MPFKIVLALVLCPFLFLLRSVASASVKKGAPKYGGHLRLEWPKTKSHISNEQNAYLIWVHGSVCTHVFILGACHLRRLHENCFRSYQEHFTIGNLLNLIKRLILYSPSIEFKLCIPTGICGSFRITTAVFGSFRITTAAPPHFVLD
jgi:hypothetical protein